jgi:predicted nucleic acid-binding protein
MTPIRHTAPAQPPTSQAIVLDTNVVLDWLVFADPVGVAVGTEVLEARLRWVVSAATMAELAVVLQRPAFDRWAGARGPAWARASAWSTPLGAAASVDPSPATMRCSDRDDQKFIDLALHVGAHWLLSRDKAVLRLARRALPLGLVVQTPMQWLAQRALVEGV